MCLSQATCVTTKFEVKANVVIKGYPTEGNGFPVLWVYPQQVDQLWGAESPEPLLRSHLNVDELAHAYTPTACIQSCEGNMIFVMSAQEIAFCSSIF